MLAATTGVNVAVSGNSVVLTDYGRGAGDSFDITYTATLVTLTGHNGTQFRVGGSSVASHTINTTHAIDLTIVLKSHANTVHITGDGTASLASLNVNCGWRDANNAVALNKVIAGSLLIQGGRGADAVTLTASTVNGPFRVALGQNSNDSLIVDHSTVNGDMDAAAGTITADHATFGGRVAANQSGRDNTFDTTASTFNHDFRDRLGPDAVVNFHPSTDGANKFHGQADLIGRRRHHATLNTTTTAATFDAGRDFIRVDARLVAGPTAPVVTSQTVEVAPATVSGTFDSVQAPSLAVTVGTKTFTLGTDSQLHVATALGCE